MIVSTEINMVFDIHKDLSIENLESAVEAGLVCAGRLRHIIPVGGVSSLEGSVLRSAFEGRV